MKIGFSIDEYKGLEPSIIIALMKKIGLEHVELTRSAFKDLAGVKKQMRNLSAGFHLPVLEVDGFDFSTPAHEARISEVISELNAHWRELNIRYCVAHPPEPEQVNMAIETSTPFLLQNLARLQAPILLENVPTSTKSKFASIRKQAGEKLGDKLAGLCFDAAHGYLSGEDIVGWFAELNGEIKCVHLSDCSASKDLHLPFDCGGVLPIESFLNTMALQRYQGTINLEIMPRSLHDLEPVLKSYLTVLKQFKKSKYLTTKAKVMALAPLIRSVTGT